MDTRYIIEVFKCYTMKDDVNHVLNYLMPATDLSKVITGWQDAGYVVKSIVVKN